MKFYIDAVHKYRVDDQKLPRDTGAFVSEQAAMHMREADVIGTLKEKGPKVEYMTAPIPRGTASIRARWCGAPTSCAGR